MTLSCREVANRSLVVVCFFEARTSCDEQLESCNIVFETNCAEKLSDSLLACVKLSSKLNQKLCSSSVVCLNRKEESRAVLVVEYVKVDTLADKISYDLLPSLAS